MLLRYIGYFSTKIELVIETAEFYWQKVAEKYLTELEQTDTGYVQLQKIMNVLERIFQEEKAFLKFLQEFDVFVKKYQISEERLTEYESGILRLKPYVTDALEKGLADESLFFTCSIDEMYFSLTHTLLAVMQKLAVTKKFSLQTRRLKEIGSSVLSRSCCWGDQGIKLQCVAR